MKTKRIKVQINFQCPISSFLTKKKRNIKKTGTVFIIKNKPRFRSLLEIDDKCFICKKYLLIKIFLYAVRQFENECEQMFSRHKFYSVWLFPIFDRCNCTELKQASEWYLKSTSTHFRNIAAIVNWCILCIKSQCQIGSALNPVNDFFSI